MILDLIATYLISNSERYRYVLVKVDYFSEWEEFVPLGKASASTVSDIFFGNFVSKYIEPIILVSDLTLALHLIFLRFYVLR